MIFKGIKSGVIDISEQHLGIHDDALTASWESNQTINTSDEVLFTLLFESRTSNRISKQLKLSSRITKSEVYTGIVADDVFYLDLIIDQGDLAKVILEQNDPNPFIEQTVINFILPSAEEATLTIFNVDGKEIKRMEGDFSKGKNSIILKRHDLETGGGVMYYQLQVNDVIITKKMIVIR